jgi:hypothetical protein
VSADVWAVPAAPVTVTDTLADTPPHNVPDGISDTYDGGAERLTDSAAYGGAHSI